jgi:hypothetical protein
MQSKKQISILLKNISDGDYAKAKGNVKAIVESKISDRIKVLNSSTKQN